MLRVRLKCSKFQGGSNAQLSRMFGGASGIFLLDTVFNWVERRFGFGRGCSCSGFGCGIILLFIFLVAACSIVTHTDWLHLIR
jgi:hypothetical protein